ncbi:MAG: tetratricopeptide repeat protein [Flavobacteriales bacterium]|nr:tetratricopeptide repeat protein [Flavobacteriales bacterium]
MKKLILNFIFLATTTLTTGQTIVKEAFSKSYLYESDKDYSQAISVIFTVYDVNSYTMNLRLGWLNYLAGEYIKSQGFYKKAIALESKSIEARLGYVYPTSAMENWDDVIKTYNEILSIDPYNSTVNYRMASIYSYRKEYVKAAAYAEKVVTLYPFDYDSNYLLGHIYISLGKIKEAKICLIRALHYNPSSIEVKTLLDKI